MSLPRGVRAPALDAVGFAPCRKPAELSFTSRGQDYKLPVAHYRGLPGVSGRVTPRSGLFDAQTGVSSRSGSLGAPVSVS